MIDYPKILGETGILPVVTINNSKNAVSVANAFLNAGQRVAEVPLRTEAALESINKISTETDFIVGAGTILTIEQGEKAIKAGAKFLVSPGFNPQVVKLAQENNINILPGVATPTEIELAMSFGIKTMKLYPAEFLGGVDYLKALYVPYSMVNFVPMCGIDNNNIKDYLSCSNVIAVGGSWLAKADMIDRCDFKTIEKMTRNTINLIKKIN